MISLNFRPILGVFIACYPFTYSEAQNEMRVGVILPLSGPAAHAGDACKKAIQYKMSELGDNNNVDVFFEDDQGVGTRTISAFRKLRDVDNINLVISALANPSNVLKPIAERESVPLIAATSDDRLTSNSQSTFLYWLPANKMTSVIFDELQA